MARGLSIGGALEISALEINQYFIRAIKLGHSGSTLTIKKICEVVLPEGLIINSRLVKPQEFAAVLGDFLKRNHFGTSNWIVSIPDGPVFTTYKIFPSLEEENLEEAIEINASTLLPGNVENISWGWQEIEPLAKTGGKEVMISSISKQELNQYLFAFNQIGLVPIALEPKSCSMARVFGKTDNWLVINVEANIVTFTVIKAGFPRFTREAKIIGNTLDEQIKDLCFKAKQTVNFYLTEKKEKTIEKIVLDGSGAKPAITQAISRNVGVATVLSSEMLQIGGFRLSYMPLVGAGIRGLYDPKDDANLSLLPVGTREATAEKRTLLFYSGLSNIIVTTAVIFVLIFFGAVGLLAYLERSNSDQIQMLSTLKTQSGNQTDTSLSTEIIPLINKEAAIEKQLTVWSPLLDNLESLIPTGITVTQMTSQSTEVINLNGVATSQEALVAFRESLSGSEYFTSVSMPSSSVSSKNITFTITVNINKDFLVKK